MGWIKNRINAEYKKHKSLDWAAIAEAKIMSTVKTKINGLFSNAELGVEMASVISKEAGMGTIVSDSNLGCIKILKQQFDEEFKLNKSKE